MKEIQKRFFPLKPAFWLTCLLCVFLTACSDDDNGNESGDGKGNAPSKVTGNEFVFYSAETAQWQFRVTSTGSDGKAALMVNSDLSVATDPYCYYRKTEGNMATIQINYSSYVAMGGVMLGRMTLLDLKLTFTSAHGGIYTGTSTVTGGMGQPSTSQISGYFSYGTEFSPTWTGGTVEPGGGDEDGDEQEGGSQGGVASSVLGARISSVSTSDYYQQHDITVTLKKYTTVGLPPTVGFILGTAPGVTLDNAIIVGDEKSFYLENLKYAAVLGATVDDPYILKSGTRYYIRPYHRSGSVVTYYEETSVETLGGDITLDLRNNLIPVFTFAYNFKRSGSYEISANFRINNNGNVSFYKKTYKTVSGGSGSVTVDARNDTPYDWDQIENIWGIAVDRETGITYQSPSIHGGANRN